MKPRPKTDCAKSGPTSWVLLFVVIAGVLSFWQFHRNRAIGDAGRKASNEEPNLTQSQSTQAVSQLRRTETPPTNTSTEASLPPGTGASNTVPVQLKAAYWIKLAEQKCVPHFDYRVAVATQTGTNQTSGTISSEGADSNQTLVSMVYSLDKGLRLDASSGSASFSVDVASMLRKMSSQTTWVIEKEENLDGEATFRVASVKERLAVTLWIRREDGAVLRLDQSIDGKPISSCNLTYLTFNGSLVPQRITTTFPPTGRTITQEYTGYTLSDANK